jgi:hypothetical protein
MYTGLFGILLGIRVTLCTSYNVGRYLLNYVNAIPDSRVGLSVRK